MTTRRIIPFGLLWLPWIVVGVTALAPLNAQQPARATIEGDVYLMMQSGDTKKGAGRTVLLVPATTAIVTNVEAICRERAIVTELAAARARRSRDSSQAWLDAGALFRSDKAKDLWQVLRAYAADSAKSGLNAHYRFSQVAPGRYLLFTSWVIGEFDYLWLVPVTVGSGQRITRDLDNDAIAANTCGTPR